MIYYIVLFCHNCEYNPLITQSKTKDVSYFTNIVFVSYCYAFLFSIYYIHCSLLKFMILVLDITHTYRYSMVIMTLSVVDNQHKSFKHMLQILYIHSWAMDNMYNQSIPHYIYPIQSSPFLCFEHLLIPDINRIYKYSTYILMPSVVNTCHKSNK